MNTKTTKLNKNRIFSIQLPQLLISMVVSVKLPFGEKNPDDIFVVKIQMKENSYSNNEDEVDIFGNEKPGIISGIITIGNRSNIPREVKIYQNDSIFFRETPNRVTQNNARFDDVGKWVNFLPANFVVDAEGEKDIRFIINIPMDKQLQGNYWSKIFIESNKQSNPMTRVPPKYDIVWN